MEVLLPWSVTWDGGGDSELKPNATAGFARFEAHVQRYEDLTQST